jgi:hypothetical protein
VQGFTEPARRVERFVAGLQGANELDQRHVWDGDKEVSPRDFVRLGGSGGHGRDTDRRGITGQNGFRSRDAIEFPE